MFFNLEIFCKAASNVGPYWQPALVLDFIIDIMYIHLAE